MTDDVFFKELDHTADLRVEVYGRGLADLFHNAVKTLYRVLNIRPFSVDSEQDELEEGIVNVYGIDREDALIKMMSELLYLSIEERRQLIVDKVLFNAAVSEDSGFRVTLKGRWHFLKRDVFAEIKEIKAVTYYGVNIERDSRGFTATVVMDT